jgi:hypothetical protein
VSAVIADRMRMALAEAGYPDASVRPFGLSVAWADVPCRVAWRAGVVTGAVSIQGRPLACFACFVVANDTRTTGMTENERGWDCLARGEGIEDCGADRAAVAT